MKTKLSKTFWAATALAGLALGLLSSLRAADRFDYKVRNDFFAGFAGSPKLLERGMKACEETLGEDPNHPEALVWHGAGLYYLAGESFQKGDAQKGMELYAKGLAEMDRAVALAPDSIGVRIPRGAVLLSATAYQPDSPRVQSEVKRAAADYQRSYDLQKDRLDQMATHPLGQLLLGLGDAYGRTGEKDKAESYMLQVTQRLKGTEYEKRAQSWLAKKSFTPDESRCIGCHTPN